MCASNKFAMCNFKLVLKSLFQMPPMAHFLRICRVLKDYLSGELQANVVTAFAVSHHIPGQLAISQHDIPKIQGSCREQEYSAANLAM